MYIDMYIDIIGFLGFLLLLICFIYYIIKSNSKNDYKIIFTLSLAMLGFLCLSIEKINDINNIKNPNIAKDKINNIYLQSGAIGHILLALLVTKYTH